VNRGIIVHNNNSIDTKIENIQNSLKILTDKSVSCYRINENLKDLKGRNIYEDRTKGHQLDSKENFGKIEKIDNIGNIANIEDEEHMEELKSIPRFPYSISEEKKSQKYSNFDYLKQSPSKTFQNTEKDKKYFIYNEMPINIKYFKHSDMKGIIYKKKQKIQTLKSKCEDLSQNLNLSNKKNYILEIECGKAKKENLDLNQLVNN